MRQHKNHNKVFHNRAVQLRFDTDSKDTAKSNMMFYRKEQLA